MLKKAKQLIKIKSGKIWKFFGGVKAPQLKYAAEDPIEELGIPALITLPVERHLGEMGQILVASGDYVKRGQALTAPDPKGRLVPLHASTSGTVLHIAPQVLPHPSGFTGSCITIKPDGLDNSVTPDPLNNWDTQDNATILEQIRKMGVEGMGGALFQTAAKLGSAIKDNIAGCSVFIVNGCECEPGLSCDDRLMRENAAEIAQGIKIIQKIIKPEITLVAIEDNKQEAIKSMREAVADIAEVRILPSRYPEGSARSLIKAVTGLEIPYDVHTSETGVVVNNVATVLAVKKAVIDGLAVTERVITVIGKSLKKHGNVRVRLGTSVRFILSNFHLNPDFRQRIIMGGPMMGFTLPSIDVPITKATAAIMAPGQDEIPPSPESLNCIRCGRCARVCPSRLVPYQMYAFSKAGDHAKANKCGINDCVLCGCCAFECPSHIDLTVQFRREQALSSIIYENEKRNQRAQEVAKEHEKKEEERKKRLAEKKAAALARIKAGNGAPKKAVSSTQTSLEKTAIIQDSAKDALANTNSKEITNSEIKKVALSPEELAERRQKALLAAQKRREALAKKQAEMANTEITKDEIQKTAPTAITQRENEAPVSIASNAMTADANQKLDDIKPAKNFADSNAEKLAEKKVNTPANPYIKKAPASIFANVKDSALVKDKQASSNITAQGHAQTLSDVASIKDQSATFNINRLDNNKIPQSLKAEKKIASRPLPRALKQDNSFKEIRKQNAWNAPELLPETNLSIVGTAVTKNSQATAPQVQETAFNEIKAKGDRLAKKGKLPQNLKKSNRAPQ